MSRVTRMALAAALTAAVTVVVTPAPALAVTTLTAANFRLTPGSYSTSAISALDAALPNKTVSDVIASANRDASPCSPAVSATGQVQLSAAFCWNSGDSTTTDWMPQAISTSADALDAGTYDGRTVIIASWYDSADDGIDKGVRISFVDYSDPADPDYRHVLLVEPYYNASGQATFRAVNIHAGGMAWYGHYLYVADTSYGFRVFDFDHIWQVSTGDNSKIGRQSDGTYHAFDYQYAIPQALRYTQSTAGGYAAFRFSFVSLDRTSSPDSLVVGEYGNPGGGTRLARFNIDYTDRLLFTDSSNLAKAVQAYDVSVTSMQGATAINGEWWLSTSDGTGNNGDLVLFRPGAATPLTYYYDDLPIGPEDVSYWRDKGQVWTLTEHPGKRSVVAIRYSAY